MLLEVTFARGDGRGGARAVGGSHAGMADLMSFEVIRVTGATGVVGGRVVRLLTGAGARQGLIVRGAAQAPGGAHPRCARGRRPGLSRPA